MGLEGVSSIETLSMWWCSPYLWGFVMLFFFAMNSFHLCQYVCVCVCVQTSFESGTKIVKLGFKNVARFAFHKWNKIFNGLAL
jgi:hypothetical protein